MQSKFQILQQYNEYLQVLAKTALKILTVFEKENSRC